MRLGTFIPEHLCRFAVRALVWYCLADFLGSLITLAIARPGGLAYFRTSAPSAGLPADVSAYFLKPAIPSAGGGATSPSPRRPIEWCRNLDRLSICLAFRLIIRFRLTPGRLTSPGNPWSYGEGESHPLYRYLYLHLLFLTLHRGSRLRLRRGQECSPTDPMDPAASAHSLIPDYYPCPIPRLVSCYALFE